METHEYDTPEADEVYQQDPAEPPFPVEVKVVGGTVRTDELPTVPAYRYVPLGTGGRPEKVLNADPKRKKAIIWCIALGGGIEGVLISGSEGDCTQNAGAVMLVGTGALRFEITGSSELWAKGIVINETTGTFSGFGPSTDDGILSIISEQWAK